MALVVVVAPYSFQPLVLASSPPAPRIALSLQQSGHDSFTDVFYKTVYLAWIGAFTACRPLLLRSPQAVKRDSRGSETEGATMLLLGVVGVYTLVTATRVRHVTV